MRRIVTVGVVCWLLIAASIGVGAVTASTGAMPNGETVDRTQLDGTALEQTDIDPDDILLSVDVAANGTARWTIEYRTELTTDEDVQAFEAIADEIAADPSEYESRFEDRMNTTAEEASAATGREMAITGMTVSADRRELPREYGVISYEFQWQGFATTADDQLVIGDAIEGMFLDEDTRLLVSWPESYALETASPNPTETRDQSVMWSGPTEFGSGQPQIVTAERGLLSAIGPLGGLAAAAVILALLAGGILFYRRRRGDDAEGTVPEPAAVDGTTGAAASGTAGTAADEADTADADETDETADAIDQELLSNEEQVIKLLAQNGGRMKQQAVAEELGWTDAKTSQVTKGLREEGDLDGFRLGRENVLSLPEEDDSE
ncbi:DUF7345 domain-containing protein [Halalkalirubrum salinum]|uniref:DUF7345 domain-containing protein n=1 Tax=Halalkalirubrum salinum TaxID=2563889 RepID=UPI0010FAE472|nr:DUF4897 domain-containing protein [Halalkalirubrum salinum]